MNFMCISYYLQKAKTDECRSLIEPICIGGVVANNLKILLRNSLNNSQKFSRKTRSTVVDNDGNDDDSDEDDHLQQNDTGKYYLTLQSRRVWPIARTLSLGGDKQQQNNNNHFVVWLVFGVEDQDNWRSFNICQKPLNLECGKC